MAFLRRFYQIASGFHFFQFWNNIFFIEQEYQSTPNPNPQAEASGPFIYVPQSQSGPVIPPSTGFHFRRFYDSLDYGGGILTGLHMGKD
jgi:hypothetical protein